MKDYFIREGYEPRMFPDYFNDVKPDQKIWQPDVIPLSVYLARKCGSKHIIDIGCGRATGLIPYSSEFQITGIDFGDNLTYCRENYSWGRWIDCDLENEIPDIDTKDAVVICSDVIEHIPHPDNLLATLMMSAVCTKLVVISTPDRERVYGYDQGGMPGNKSHVREWTLAELCDLLTACNLPIVWRGWTVSNNVDRQKNTSLVVVSREKLCYNAYTIDGVFDAEAG